MSVHRTSLPLWRLPEFNFVALWIHDPSEFPVLRVVGLLEHVATFLAECFEKCCQIFDSIVDHERRLARSEVFAVRWTDQPGRSSLGRVAFGVSPGEGRAAPVLNVDPKVLLVPSAQRFRILGAEEDAANACDSSHSNLRLLAK